MQQVLGGPQPFPRERPVGGLVNQTNEVQLVGHRRELAADGLRRENESMIEHKILPKGHNSPSACDGPPGSSHPMIFVIAGLPGRY